MLLPLLWRPRRVLSYDVATWADTSSNQASKVPGQLRCGYSNLGKIYLSLDFSYCNYFNNVGRLGCGLCGLYQGRYFEKAELAVICVLSFLSNPPESAVFGSATTMAHDQKDNENKMYSCIRNRLQFRTFND
jgi:hypothetical protein